MPGKTGAEEVTRRAAKVDNNHEAIVSALRAAGASVQSMAALGRGVPDLLVWFRGYYIIECKDGAKPPSKRQLTKDQEDWIKAWGGPVYVVESPEQALIVVGATA